MREKKLGEHEVKPPSTGNRRIAGLTPVFLDASIRAVPGGKPPDEMSNLIVLEVINETAAAIAAVESPLIE